MSGSDRGRSRRSVTLAPYPRWVMLARRRITLAAVFALAAFTLAACSRPQPWHGVDISGSLPRLSFTMTRANDGKIVTAADYRGKVVMLYFGYTFCPDICPTTLANIALILKRLGPQAAHVRFLFVTIDPNRDTLAALKRYTALFAPEMDGLRGTPDEIAELARRYRVTYSVHPGGGGKPYTVSHGAAIYAFDTTGRARVLLPIETVPHPDLAGTAADLTRLIDESAPKGFLGWLRQML